MNKALQLLLAVLTIAYPFMVYFGFQHGGEQLLILLLFSLLALRWFSMRGPEKSVLQNTKSMLLIGLSLALVIYYFGERVGLKAYPVLVNSVLLITFFSSLFSAMPIVERLARLKEGTLSAKAVVYTRKVTWLWCAFFLLNTLIATYTGLYSSDEVWVLYNGFISYVLIGLVALGEWLVRIKVKREHSESE